MNVGVFDLYFASVVSMQYHPGAGSMAHRRLTLEECAKIAMEMVEIRERLREEDGVEV